MVNAVGMGAPSGRGGEGSSLSPDDAQRVTTRCHHRPCPWGAATMCPTNGVPIRVLK